MISQLKLNRNPKSVSGKIFFLIAVLGLTLNATFALAAAPLKVDLSYDPEKAILHIDITHHTHDRNEHYIKKVVIYKNNEKPVVLYFRQQPDPVHFVVDTPLQAVPGDVIRVEATDRQGGTKTGELVVPEPEAEEPSVDNPALFKQHEEHLGNIHENHEK